MTNEANFVVNHQEDGKLDCGKRELSARATLDLHQTVMRDLDPDWAGRLRNAPVFIKGTRHTPPNAAQVSGELDALVTGQGQNALHPVLVAAETHFRFESLHPFFDGNGRTGRLLLNWQLLRAGFPPTVIQVEERSRGIWARWITGTQANGSICNPWSRARSSAVWIWRRPGRMIQGPRHSPNNLSQTARFPIDSGS